MIRSSVGFLVVVAVVCSAQNQKKHSPKPAAPAGEAVISVTHFSATMSGGMAKEDPKKIYRSGNLVRVDFEKKFHVTDVQKRITYGVQPTHCAVFPGPDVDTIPFLPLSLAEFKVERSMTDQMETVEEHPCKIENATFTPKDKDRGPIKAKLWEAQDLQGFPVKVELDPGNGHISTFNYHDVSLLPPDPKLFQIPANCVGLGKEKKGQRPDLKSSTPKSEASK